MKKLILTPESQITLWFWLVAIIIGVLMAVILTFITEFFNAII